MLATLAFSAGRLLEALLPSRCAACGAFGADVCSRCQNHFLHMPRSHGSCCFGFLHHALGAYAGELRAAILAIKFRQRKNAAFKLGKILALRHVIDADYLIPVPLHRQRERERGFNQALAIASGISEVCGIPVLEDAILRRRHTVAQSRLSLQERHCNVERAFAAGPQARRVAGRATVLVDDVMTTGATLRACASVLAACGAAGVAVAVLARKQ